MVMFKFTAQASEELTFDGHLAASLVSDGGEGGDLQMMDVATVKGRGTMNPTLKSPFLWTWCFGLSASEVKRRTRGVGEETNGASEVSWWCCHD